MVWLRGNPWPRLRWPLELSQSKVSAQGFQMHTENLLLVGPLSFGEMLQEVLRAQSK